MSDHSECLPALSEQQITFVDAFLGSSESYFLSGRAGSGKTRVIMEVIARLKKTLSPSEFAVTAMTGIAAASLEFGQTFNSACGFALGKSGSMDYVGKIKKDPSLFRRWIELKVIIIDEISMMSRQLSEMFDEVAREVRGCNHAWGGLQVLFVGDLMQLPPVNGESPCKGNLWNGLKTFMLTTIHRQNTDGAFLDLCNIMRYSTDTFNHDKDDYIRKHLINKDKINLWPKGVHPVHIFGTNALADEMNNEFLSNLNGEEHKFDAVDFVRADSAVDLDDVTNLLKSFRCKVQLPVMFLRNILNVGLVNGSKGVIVDFISKAELDDPNNVDRKYETVLYLPEDKTAKLPVVEFVKSDGSYQRFVVGYSTSSPEVIYGPIEYSRKQIPLRSAVALTCHRAQGMTLDYVIVHMGELFGYNHFYTAMTRCRSATGLLLTGYSAKYFEADAQKASKAKWVIKGVKHSFDTAKYYRGVMDRHPSSASYKINCSAKAASYRSIGGETYKKRRYE